MARWLVFVLLASGCKQIWGLGDTPGKAIADTPDGIIDTPDVAVDATLCFGTFGSKAPYCFPSPPSLPILIVANQTIDTTNSPLCSSLFKDECVIAGSSISVDATVSLVGTRPIIGISTGDIDIKDTGVIDVASHRMVGKRGPGADAQGCNAPEDPGTGAGGAGGSLGGAGGDGGASSGPGGQHGLATLSTTLHGGCRGGNGFGAVDGGDGGGAIYLIAASGSISIDGAINASGAAGNGAPAIQRGGGGGGSGGMIVLEAGTITIGNGLSSFVAANGGGGGGGGSQAGGMGSAGMESDGVVGGSGGVATSPAGDGGDSSTIGDPGGIKGQNGTANGGGGGGGGGAGVIKTIGGTISNQLKVSPTPS